MNRLEKLLALPPVPVTYLEELIVRREPVINFAAAAYIRRVAEIA